MTDGKRKQPFYLIDTDSDFYRPVGVRLAICLSVAAWAALEIYNGDGFWGVLSGAAAIYCVYVLFLTYNPSPKQADETVRPIDNDDEPPSQSDKDEPSQT